MTLVELAKIGSRWVKAGGGMLLALGLTCNPFVKKPSVPVVMGPDALSAGTRRCGESCH